MKTAKIVFIILVGISFLIWTIAKIPHKEKHYLTNDEVISETKKCEDNGLQANTIPYYAMNGNNNFWIENIICVPKKEQTSDTQNIKKSNITNIEIQK